MRILAVVAVLVAAVTSISPSVAGPQPREELGGRVPFRGHKMRRPPPAPVPHRVGDWVNLATSTPTRFGTEWIVVGADEGAFSAVRVQATSGTVHLRYVRVDFANGQSSMYPIDRWLTARHPKARVDFGKARHIDRIAVTTARSPVGTYVVHGSWGLTSTGQLVALR